MGMHLGLVIHSLPVWLEQASHLGLEDAIEAWLSSLEALVKDLLEPLSGQPGWLVDTPSAGLGIRGACYVHPSVRLPAYGQLEGPVYIAQGCTLGPGVYLRGPVIAGPGVVIGHGSEVKNSLLLDGAKAPHFNYVGDSILGPLAHLGAGAVLANLRFDEKPVTLRLGSQSCLTKRRKVGAILGAGAQVGCNTVLNPGTLLPACSWAASPSPGVKLRANAENGMPVKRQP